MKDETRREIKKGLIACPRQLKEINHAHFESYQGDSSLRDFFVHAYGWDIYSVGLGLNSSRYHKEQRVRERTHDFIVSGNALFLTLTFKDDILSTTNAKTRRRYVSRFLKANCEHYVANVDYGSKNGREHYHALVVVRKSVKLNQWHKLGAINLRHIRQTENDAKRVAKYTAKLSNHALKQYGTAPRLIYSRQNRVNALPVRTP